MKKVRYAVVCLLLVVGSVFTVQGLPQNVATIGKVCRSLAECAP